MFAYRYHQHLYLETFNQEQRYSKLVPKPFSCVMADHRQELGPLSLAKAFEYLLGSLAIVMRDRRIDDVYFILTWCLWQSIPTITWAAVGRIQAVNIKCSTVSHADVFWMIAAIIEKLWHTLQKTDFSLHNSLGHCWMRAIEPAGRVCDAGIHLRTRLCHLCSSPSTKSIPTRQLGIGEVTKASVCIRHRPVWLVEKCVVGTFYKRFQIVRFDFMAVNSFLNNIYAESGAFKNPSTLCYHNCARARG